MDPGHRGIVLERTFKMDLVIEPVEARRLPQDLLRLADPSEPMISRYIDRGMGFGARSGADVVGVAVLMETRPQTVELVNLAVSASRQRQGIGRALVVYVLEWARHHGYQTMEVGTGNSSMGPLALYQRCGFRIVGVDPDFFPRHYPARLEENGIWCRDLIRLASGLS